MPDIIFSTEFDKNSFRLVELSNNELLNRFESGENLIIKGQPDDEAVLCTASSTYSVRQTNTSNSHLLVTSMADTFTVVDDLSNIIELNSCLARLDRLDTLLRASSYSGPEQEVRQAQNIGYTNNELLGLVQASGEELQAGLSAKNAFVLDDRWRIFEQAYLHRLLDSLVTNATIHGHDIRSIHPQDARQCILEDHCLPDVAIMACLQAFGSIDDSQLRLDEAKVCRFLGQVILESERHKEWRLEDFMDVWRKLVPDVFAPRLDHLGGLCMTRSRVSASKEQVYITYFPLHELPTDPAQRFASLFAEKTHWEPKEIHTYIEDLAPDPKKRDALILKFARTHKTGQQVLYGSRIK